MKSQPVRTPQDVRADFLRKGQSIASWAKAHGFSVATTSQVLTGTNKATRGQGHKIAVLLGLKEGEIVEDRLEPRNGSTERRQ